MSSSGIIAEVNAITASKTASAISILSYPKINLALDILGRDSSSGYHEIQTIFHELRGYPNIPVDEIIIQDIEVSSVKAGGIEVICDNPFVPCDKTNTVLKAALLLKEHFKISRAAKIFIKKRIPLMSGLGGGASNAVAALKALAKFWGIECCEFAVRSQAQQMLAGMHKTSGAHRYKSGRPYSALHVPDCILRNLAQQIGMDCNFFFDGGTALAEHFGEKITPLSALPPQIKFEIIETGIKISSHEAYKWTDLARPAPLRAAKRCGARSGKNQHKTKKLIEALRAQDAKRILENLHNDFEEAVFEKYPALLAKKREAEKESSAANTRVLLCGSGGCLVRILLD